MKRNTQMLEMLVLIAALLITGCSTSQGTNIIDDTVAMTNLGPVQSLNHTKQSEFHLGAGDSLGRAIYFNYVAYVRANPSRRPHYDAVE